MVVGGSTQMFAAGSCPGGSSGSGTTTTTTTATQTAKNSIPASYLTWFQHVGSQYSVPWPILAGIGKVESDDGQSTAPGVHSGDNGFGAAGPMQIGISGAAGNTWGGAPAHPAGEHVNGVATDENGDGIASVYEPPDAIAGAAKYLLNNGVLSNVQQAIFAYNHSTVYVQDVLSYANMYAKGGYTVTQTGLTSSTQCLMSSAGQAPNQAVSTAIAYAEAQIGKPYVWGGTGPDGFDCSGLVMMAYNSAGVSIPRTSEEQWAWGPKIQPGQEEPGDLVFFAGLGHVGIYVGGGQFIHAPHTGSVVRIDSLGAGWYASEYDGAKRILG
jgi:cell wall-associated NlpC family hydrolase